MRKPSCSCERLRRVDRFLVVGSRLSYRKGHLALACSLQSKWDTNRMGKCRYTDPFPCQKTLCRSRLLYHSNCTSMCESAEENHYANGHHSRYYSIARGTDFVRKRA